MRGCRFFCKARAVSSNAKTVVSLFARRACSVCLALLVFTPQTALAAGKDEDAPPQRYSLAVSEGTSGGIDASQALAKYRPLAGAMQHTLGKPVNIVYVRSFVELEAGMRNGKFDFVMARPSDYPARGVRDYKYRLVATSSPDGQCYFIVVNNSPLKSIADARDKSLAFPEKYAYMTKFCTAELRDKGIVVKGANTKYVREQSAVAAAVERNLFEIGGVASYSVVARNWEKSGNRILHKSAPQPYFPLIAGSRVPAGDLVRLQVALAGLDKSEVGKKILVGIGIQGFKVESPARLLSLLEWLDDVDLHPLEE
jgi:ABC-type phosphate/phosphonate transport system substrate-binding protein